VLDQLKSSKIEDQRSILKIWQIFQYYGTGRRKTSTARVYLRPGSGKITVNKRDFYKLFPNEALADDHSSAASIDGNRRAV